MQTCLTCRADSREDIDTALLAGTPVRDIARAHGLSVSSIWRHSRSHLPEALLQSRRDQEVLHADNLVTTAEHLLARALSILERAERGGDERGALHAIREARATLEVMGKLTGDLALAQGRGEAQARWEDEGLRKLADVAALRTHITEMARREAGHPPARLLLKERNTS